MKTPSSLVFENMLQKLSYYGNDVEGFTGSFDVNNLMIEFSDNFSKSVNSMNYISTLIAKYNTVETGEQFVKLLDSTSFNEESQTLWLFKIKDIESDVIFTKLYELTGDEEYLPQSARDLFLF